MNTTRKYLLAPLALALSSLVLVGCSASDTDSNSSDSADSGSSTLTVVASTNVWGDLAATIGGDAVEVTSIIDSPDMDPHEYEASSQNQLALSKADIVIENGGGYDDFVKTMLDAADNDSAVVLDAVEISGKTAADGEELNEHVWYDLPTVERVIDEIEQSYADADPDDAEAFAANAADLTAEIEALQDRTAELQGDLSGKGVAITEPVPLYLLEAMGLENKTPDEFSEAIEEDTDVPATVLQDTLQLFTDHQVEALVYNSQTTGAQTEAVLQAAEDADVAVVPVTETLPDGVHFEEWMSDNIEAIATALGDA